MTEDQITIMAQLHYEHRLSALGVRWVFHNLPPKHQQQEIDAMRHALAVIHKPEVVQ